MKDILGQKLVKRGVSLKNLTYGKVEPAAGQSVRQKISLQQGIPVEKAKEIVRLVKDSKKKAQASIQGDTVQNLQQGPRRVAGDHRPAARQGSGRGVAVHELSHELTQAGRCATAGLKALVEIWVGRGLSRRIAFPQTMH